IWLALSVVKLDRSIPGVLDLTVKCDLPLRGAEVADPLKAPELTARAEIAMLRMLDVLGDELAPDRAPWAEDRPKLAREPAEQAFERFNKAFDRWRELYSSAHQQLEDANRRSQMPGLSGAQRAEVSNQQRSANAEIALLESNAASGTDFYTYRYLATEG